MWLSERAGRGLTAEKSADIGDVTIADAQTGVMLDGEQRSLGFTSPGGYVWRPRKGQNVVVLKGAGGETMVAGVPQPAASAALEPGEILIRSEGGCSIQLKNDGTITLSGKVEISGQLYVNGEVYKPCTCS